MIIRKIQDYFSLEYQDIYFFIHFISVLPYKAFFSIFISLICFIKDQITINFDFIQYIFQILTTVIFLNQKLNINNLEY